jgi:hypothetical protein
VARTHAAVEVGPRRRPPLALEALEERALPSAITVHTNADSGPGSLRAAVSAAAGGDTIVFDKSLNGQTITLTSGDLDIIKNLTIDGLGAGKLTISGGGPSRAFGIPAGVTATLADLTIAHGRAAAGGGIDNAGTLTVLDCAISGNPAVGGMGAGGGLDNFADTVDPTTVDVVTVTETTFLGNQALGGAGGSGAAGGVGVGGAIAVGQDAHFGFPDSPSLTLVADTFGGNLARGGDGGSGGDGWGGALGLVSGTASASGSTFGGNHAVGGSGGAGGNGGNGLGGGLFVDSGATLALTASRVEYNRAQGGEEGAGGSDGQGGGVYNLGTFTFDALAVIRKNHASTSNYDIFP